VARFVVERYLPGIGVTDLQDATERLAAATAALAAGGAVVRYLGSSFVPAEESCFCRFESDSIDSVRIACDQASVSYARILEIEELPDVRGA
jgi:Nickel responsive protein SCO4226-like